MTPDFPFLKGNFRIAGSSVPYFQLSLSARDALDHLHVARELIFDPNEIVLDELFQRDIDDERVRKEIAPYLERHGETKFFNAMVVVLLPQRNNKLQREYQIEGSQSETRVQGIDITEVGQSGSISWDPNAICPIIIDGQHRFSAIRELDAEQSVDLSETTIPVIALVLDENLGFNTASESLLSTVRKIFIDLNRQARTVSKTRNVLLDDRDVVAVAVRSLLEKQVKPVESPLAERMETGEVPLALVDWYSDKLKFDQGVHLTSILSLYQIIEDFLCIPRIDPHDYEQGESLISHFYELDPALDFRKTLSECIERKRPVFLNSQDVKAFDEWFRADWGPAFAHVLVSMEPYREHINNLIEAEFLDGPLEIWAALDAAGKRTFERSHGNSIEIHEREQQISHSKHHMVCFQVVFQRGVLRAFAEMCKALFAKSGGSKSARSYAEEWVDEFNKRLGGLCNDRDFWRGCLVRPDGAINATRTAEKAAAGVVILSMHAPIYDWCELSAEDQLRRAQDFINEAHALSTVRTTCPIESLRKTYSKPWRSLVRKLLQETQGVYGAGETPAISSYMARKLYMVLGKIPESDDDASDPTEPKDPLLKLLT